MRRRATWWAAATVFAVQWVGGCGDGEGEPDAGEGVDVGTPRCGADIDCNDGVFCNGLESCAPAAVDADARGCIPGATPCEEGETCDDQRDECLGPCGANADVDGDGRPAVACGGDDCDDGDPLRFPGATEICDLEHRDEDCDASTFGVRDADGDGFADARCCNMQSGGELACGPDCDDASAAAHPTAPEVCEGLDNDCDGSIDEGVRTDYWPDLDGDGYGDEDAAAVGACFRGEGTSETRDDCDDGQATFHPAAPEICEAVNDEDCDGDVDEGCTCTGTASEACMLPGVCALGTVQCIGGRWSECSIAPQSETCNGIDDDCNGVVDDGLRVLCYADGDDDGFSIAGADAETQCPAGGRGSVGGCPTNWTNRAPVSPDLDCDDEEASVRPGATELCNTRDDDCDGTVDELLTTTCYTDLDRDGYAPAGATPIAQCGACGAETTSRAPTLGNVDCRDNRADTYPTALEICDRRDNDCSSGGGVEIAEDQDDDGHVATEYTGCVGGPLPRDDCHDGVANAFPGQTAYFTAPICQYPGYFNPCTCATGTAGCTLSGVGCVCVTDVQFWDYDCTGTIRQQYSEPPRDCPTSCSVHGNCGGGGFLASTLCGRPGTLRTCSGSCPSGCSATDRASTQGCR